MTPSSCNESLVMILQIVFVLCQFQCLYVCQPSGSPKLCQYYIWDAPIHQYQLCKWRKLITCSGQSAMDLQLHLKRWPGNSISCEICRGQLRKYAKSPPWIHFNGLFSTLADIFNPVCSWSSIEWRKWEKNKKFLWICHRGNAKKATKSSLSSLPPSIWIYSLRLSISRDLQGLKGSKKATFLKLHLLGRGEE